MTYAIFRSNMNSAHLTKIEGGYCAREDALAKLTSDYSSLGWNLYSECDADGADAIDVFAYRGSETRVLCIQAEAA